MRNKNRLLAIMLTILLGVLGSTIALRSIAIFKFLDFKTGYFSNNILFTISNTILAVGILIYALYVFFGKSTKLKAVFDTPTITITSGICAISAAIFSVKMLEYFFKNQATSQAGVKNPAVIISLLCGVLGIVSCVHFFLNILTTHRVAVLRSYTAMGSVLFLALYAAFLYFNTDSALNSVNKIIDQMAFLSSAIFFLYEARISLGTDKWRGYVTFGLISATLIGYSSIPSLITYLVRGDVISNSVEENVFTLTVFIYIATRLLLCTTLPKDEQSPLITSFAAFASEQSRKIAENEKVYQEKYAVQISIEDLLDENENAHEGEEPVKEVIEMIETPSEEYMQNSFFGEDEVTPSHEEPTPAIKETKEEEVNYEENPDN